MKSFTLIIISLFIFQCTYAQSNVDGPAQAGDTPVAANDNLNTSPFTDNCIWDNVRALDEININGAGDGYPWLSPDGLRLYFTQNQGNNVFMIASRTSVDSLFGNLQPLGVGFAGENNRSCWLTNDELEIFFTLLDPLNVPTLYHAERNSLSDAFSTPVEVQLIGANAGYYAGASLTQDKSQLFIYSSFGGDKTTQFFNQIGNLEYEYAGSMPISTGAGELSKDGLKYYVSISNADGINLHASSRASLTDDFTFFAPLAGTANSEVTETQPATDGSGEIMVFVRSVTGGGSAADLYIATGDCLTSVNDVHETGAQLVVYPNPATDKLTIDMGNQAADQLHIYDLHGKLIIAQSLGAQENEITIDMSALEKGMYFCEVIMASGEHGMAKVIIGK